MTTPTLSIDDAVLDEVISAEGAETSPDLPEPTPPSADEIFEQYADPDGAAERDVHDEALLVPLEHELELIARLGQIRSLRDVPLYYERRSSPQPYGFHVDHTLVPKLEAMVDLVRKRVPASYGKLTRIASAGMYVAKPGMHGKGLACDWDRWTFEHVVIAPRDRDHASQDLKRRRRYWSLGAICRSVCCYTLHGEYDAAHVDHFHCDTSVSPAFNTSRSTVTLLQALLNTVHGASPVLKVDGNYGPLTRAATAKAIERLGLNGSVHDFDVWIGFLRRSARLGFALAAPGNA
jgi:hypothetical protein